MNSCFRCISDIYNRPEFLREIFARYSFRAPEYLTGTATYAQVKEDYGIKTFREYIHGFTLQSITMGYLLGRRFYGPHDIALGDSYFDFVNRIFLFICSDLIDRNYWTRDSYKLSGFRYDCFMSSLNAREDPMHIIAFQPIVPARNNWFISRYCGYDAQGYLT